MGLLLTVLSGFAAAAVAPLLARWSPRSAGWALALLPAGITISLAADWSTVIAGGSVSSSTRWVPGLDVALAFYLDGLSLFFCLLVTVIGALVLVYSGGYMAEDPGNGRFYASMMAFMASMLGLILSDNVLTLYIFFELTTFASYFLIAHEPDDEKARRAARQALLLTNIGGLALLAALLLLGRETGSWDISALIGMGDSIRASDAYVSVVLLVAVAAFTKSAQFPFYSWLPNAMEAPTPVSAYLHSAAMVKAGIYLLARLQPALGGTRLWFWLIGGVGAFTMIVTAWLALRETDLKRVLAYSTIASLGMLTMLLGLGGEKAVEGAILFVLVHALYKAALFMTTGAVDHLAGTRDVRRLGGLRRVIPYTFAASVLAALSMAGVVPFLGFAGKEAAYAAVFQYAAAPALWTTLIVLASVALVTAAGIAGLGPFLGKPAAGALAGAEPGAHRHPMSMWLPPAILALLGLFGLVPGVLDGVVGAAVSAVLGAPSSVHLGLWHGLTPELGLSGITLAAGIAVYARRDILRESRPMALLSNWLARRLDRSYDRFVDGITATGTMSTRVLQRGRLTYYLNVILLSVVVLGAATLLRYGEFGWPGRLGEVLLYEWAIAALIVLAAAGSVVARRRFTTFLTLSMVGAGQAVIFLLFGAPDLAMTQLLIGFLTVILIVLAFVDLPDVEPRSALQDRPVAAVVALSFGALITTLLLVVVGSPMDDTLRQFYGAASYTQAHGRNIVSVILVDFRALDTLGEITVIAAAGIGVYALMRIQHLKRRRRSDAPLRKQRNKHEPLPSLPLRETARLLVPLMLVFSVFLLFRGHEEPGGGFNAGLVAAGGLILYALSFSTEDVRSALRVSPRLILGVGLGIALISGLISLAADAGFLNGSFFVFEVGIGTLSAISPALLFDTGIYLVIVGAVLTILLTIEEAFTSIFPDR